MKNKTLERIDQGVKSVKATVERQRVAKFPDFEKWISEWENPYILDANGVKYVFSASNKGDRFAAKLFFENGVMQVCDLVLPMLKVLTEEVMDVEKYLELREEAKKLVENIENLKLK